MKPPNTRNSLLFGQVRRFREKAIANCHKSAHGEEMSEQLGVRPRKNAGL
jgi:hypothetical protein